jgi:hypothetical protein
MGTKRADMREGAGDELAGLGVLNLMFGRMVECSSEITALMRLVITAAPSL